MTEKYYALPLLGNGNYSDIGEVVVRKNLTTKFRRVGADVYHILEDQ